MIPEPKIQNDLHRRFSSGAKYILLHLAIGVLAGGSGKADHLEKVVDGVVHITVISTIVVTSI